MKIFNWVNQKFNRKVVHQSLQKEQESTHSVKKIGAEQQALLGQVSLVDVLDGWKDGCILTIGTLGFVDHPNNNLKPFNLAYNEIQEGGDEEYEDEKDSSSYTNDEYDDEESQEEGDDEEGEDNPLVYGAFGKSCKDNEMGFDMSPLMVDLIIEETMSVGKKNGERTTLADLFSADSDSDEVNNKRDVDDHHPRDQIKIKSGSDGKKLPLCGKNKNVTSFAKKLIPRVGEDSRPIKKLNQLMRRMLKKKIHPELEGKMIHKSDGQINDELGANEGVSLLQTQEAIVV